MSTIATSINAVSTMWGSHVTARPRAFTRADRRPPGQALSTTAADAERLDKRPPMPRYGVAAHTARAGGDANEDVHPLRRRGPGARPDPGRLRPPGPAAGPDRAAQARPRPHHLAAGVGRDRLQVPGRG